jgi:mono/diheme cytochrome c family protein
MKYRCLTSAIGALLALAVCEGASAAEPDTARLYDNHCAQCHGADRLGQLGPALLPENLGRLTGARAILAIANGRAATQMPGFAGTLSN